jgi:hypothetical protein
MFTYEDSRDLFAIPCEFSLSCSFGIFVGDWWKVTFGLSIWMPQWNLRSNH